jgi:hypothetical protein
MHFQIEVFLTKVLQATATNQMETAEDMQIQLRRILLSADVAVHPIRSRHD